MRKDIFDMIASNRFCVLATAADDAPHCSLMSYACSDDCRELYMATQKSTKKYDNLRKNPTVSLLVDSRQSDSTRPLRALTITGTYLGAYPSSEKPDLRNRLIERHPDLNSFINDDQTEIVVIKIRALQLLDGVLDAYYEEVP